MGAHVLAMQSARNVEPGGRHIAGVGMARIEADISRLAAYRGFSAALKTATQVEVDADGSVVCGGGEVHASVVALVADAWPTATWWVTEDDFLATGSNGNRVFVPAFLAAVDGRVVAIAAPRVP